MNHPHVQPGRPMPGDRSGPATIATLCDAFLHALADRHFSPATIKLRHHSLWWFCHWCWERELTAPAQITRPILERYQRTLAQYRGANDRPLSVRAQRNRLLAVQLWFKWLLKQHYLPANPAADLDLPRQTFRLPKTILSPLEVETVLTAIDVTTPFGIRDRALLETLYSTAMRRSEVIKLRVTDIDLERGIVEIREGKGRKDRFVPIGDRACAWIAKYLDAVRPQLQLEPDSGVLFLTHFGQAFSPTPLSLLVHQRIEAAGLGKTGSCHVFRHSCATAMLDNGADIRFVQELLGHSRLDTTQLYTHVSIRQLKAIHAATHPARLTRTTPPITSDPHSQPRPANEGTGGAY